MDDCFAGQEYGSTRITWRSLYDEAVSIFIGDSIFSEKDAVVRYGILRTLWSILIRPTTTVREYLAGKQCKYVPPLTLLMLVCTICLLLLNWFQVKLLDFSFSTEDDDPILQNISEFLNYYFNNHLELLLNKDKNIKVNYQGERPYSITMTAADRQALASVYELAQLLSSMTEIKKNMEEANLKIEFVKKKMGQHRGGYQDGGLLAVQDALHHRPQGHLRLAVAARPG